MQIDRRTLNGLLALNDDQLAAVIARLAAQSGIDPRELGIDVSSIQSIRAALSGATDAELERIMAQYKAKEQGGKGGK